MAAGVAVLEGAGLRRGRLLDHMQQLSTQARPTQPPPVRMRHSSQVFCPTSEAADRAKEGAQRSTAKQGTFIQAWHG